MEPNTIQTFKKSDYLSATEMAKKYNLDPEKTYSLMLSLFKTRTPFTYISHSSKITNTMVFKFAHSRSKTSKLPLKLHPLAEELFLEKYNKRYGMAEQMNAGAQILKAGIQMAEIQTEKNDATDNNTKRK